MCGITFFSNITTIECDLEEYLKELLEENTSYNHSMENRKSNERAGEEITLYDGKTRTMYHTFYSRLSRVEIQSMIDTVKKLDK